MRRLLALLTLLLPILAGCTEGQKPSPLKRSGLGAELRGEGEKPADLPKPAPPAEADKPKPAEEEKPTSEDKP